MGKSIPWWIFFDLGTPELRVKKNYPLLCCDLGFKFSRIPKFFRASLMSIDTLCWSAHLFGAIQDKSYNVVAFSHHIERCLYLYLFSFYFICCAKFYNFHFMKFSIQLLFRETPFPNKFTWAQNKYKEARH